MAFNFFGQSLSKLVCLNNFNKTFTRFRRIQTRRPVAVYKDFNEAAEKHAFKEHLKEEKKKMPSQSTEFNKHQQQQKKQPLIKNKSQKFESINNYDVNEEKILEELQKEANRVYFKHDPYSQHETLTKDMIKDIKENVGFLETRLRNQDETVDKILKLTEGDHRFGPAIQIAKSLRHRYEKKKILLDGKRLILDALESGVKIESIFLTKDTLIKELDFNFSNLDYKINFYQVTPRSMATWSDVQTSQGFMAIAHMPAPGECKISRTLDLPFTLVLDQIRDPGNMGTLIRAAAAIGCKKILVSKGSVDIWDPKVIRSGMGGHFRVPIMHDLTYEQIDTYLPIDTKLLYADSFKSNKNESYIQKLDYTQLDKIIPTHEDHVTLVIGNEAFGLNKIIFSLGSNKVVDQNRAIINVPLDNGVESLNCAIAFSVLGYEIRRLLLRAK